MSIDETGRRLIEIVTKFVADNRIGCAETIYQTDRVQDNALEFIEELCDVVGYAAPEDQ